MKNALALVVGNQEYTLDKNKLVNAQNDANAFSDKLMRLGFTVQKKLNITGQEFERNVTGFGNELKHYQYGLFYFSGHGLQIDGQNYLTAIDTSFEDDISAKHTSMQLDRVIQYMNRAELAIKILILDACRNNPLKSQYRGPNPIGLAPIHAPRGTIIAFSTSPGEVALDYGGGNNSIYTGALLNHIDDANIPIEEFFKRVRTSVYNLSEGKQISWEHTSLIGDFFFNTGDLVHSLALPYREECVADRQWQSRGTIIDQMIEGLKTHNFHKQGPEIDRIRSAHFTTTEPSDLFLLGRNILQTACGREFKARDLFSRLGNFLTKFDQLGENHVLNGMLYEMYFNSSGRLREGGFKSDFVDELYGLQDDQRYTASFNFILNQLLPFRDFLFYLPHDVHLPLDLVFEKIEVIHNFGSQPDTIHLLKSIKEGTLDLLHAEGKHPYGNFEISLTQLVERIKLRLCVPSNRLRLSYNFPAQQLKTIQIPWQLLLSRQPPPDDANDF